MIYKNKTLSIKIEQNSFWSWTRNIKKVVQVGSYDYHEEYKSEKDLNQSSSSISLGNMVLAILKKPIEWITLKPSTEDTRMYKNDLPNMPKTVNKTSKGAVSNTANSIYYTPIEDWSISSHPFVEEAKSNPALPRGETGGRVRTTDRQFRPYYSRATHVFSSKAKLE